MITPRANVTKGLIGGLLGLGAGELDRSNKKKVGDVKLEKDSKFGVRLDEDLIHLPQLSRKIDARRPASLIREAGPCFFRSGESRWKEP